MVLTTWDTALLKSVPWRLGADGKLTPLVRDERLDWPDGVRMAADGWLYVTVNQLDSTPPFNDGKDSGQAPYRIFKVWPVDN